MGLPLRRALRIRKGIGGNPPITPTCVNHLEINEKPQIQEVTSNSKLEKAWTPYSIGKEFTAMIEKLFEASIPATTIENRAESMKNPTNVGNSIATTNHSENQQKQ